MARILFVITQSEIGGAQRFLLEFAPYIVRQGHEVSVAAGEGDGELFRSIEGMAWSMEGLKITNYCVPSLVRNLNPLNDAKALFSLVRIIQKECPDILFLQSTKAGFLGSLAVKLLSTIPSIPHTHPSILVVYRIGGWAFNDPRPWWMNRIVFWMEKISARWKDVIVVNSEYDKKLAIEKKIAPAEKIVKIYNGIDPSSLNFLTKEKARSFVFFSMGKETARDILAPPLSLNVREGAGEESYHSDKEIVKQELLVGTIANLYATKGLEYLIESAHILCQLPVTSYQLQFVVIGEGPERPKLEALIKKYNLQDKFFLVGRMSNATQYLKAFDIFVLPSVKEGFPWVLLEAMAAEVPIVATKVGALPEVIEDRKDGLLVAPKDAADLAKKISRLANLQILHDRGVFARNAKEKLKHFFLRKMLEETYATLKA